jgi:hypothetical protein
MMKRNSFLTGLAAFGVSLTLKDAGWATDGAKSSDDSPVQIDADYPGGNIVVERVELGEGKVTLRPDLRDTEGWWFYWDFRVRGAQGRKLWFEFIDQAPIAALGPAVSVDGGKTWRWLKQQEGGKSFHYTFGAVESEARFSLGMTYTQIHWNEFLNSLEMRHPELVKTKLKREVLCQSRKGDEVPYYRLGSIEQEPKMRMLITARSHACEMMASYALEGIIQAVLADSPEGSWLREKVEFLVVPFVDWDGVKAGDQGKNRRPRDHNRDYDESSAHPETRALQPLVSQWSRGKLKMSLDMHCPWVRGGMNEVIYFVGNKDPRNQPEEEKFGKMLEKLNSGRLPYRQSDDLPFGQGWNVASSFSAGRKNSDWARTLDGIRLAATMELPYAVASGVEVTAESARELGNQLAKAIEAYLKELE